MDDGDYVATMPVGKTDAPIVDDAGWRSLAESVSAGCVGVGVLDVLEKMVCEASIFQMLKCSNTEGVRLKMLHNKRNWCASVP